MELNQFELIKVSVTESAAFASILSLVVPLAVGNSAVEAVGICVAVSVELLLWRVFDILLVI